MILHLFIDQLIIIVSKTCHFSGLFRISRVANLQQWIFFSFLDVFLMFLEKSEVMSPFFRNKTSAVMACLVSTIIAFIFLPLLIPLTLMKDTLQALTFFFLLEDDTMHMYLVWIHLI